MDRAPSVTFYLVRHAHATWQPDEMRPLSATGQRAAHELAQWLAHSKIDAIVSSPYRRAWQTVRPLAERLALSISIEHDLRERLLSATPLPESTFPAAVHATWDDPTHHHAGGESNQAAQARGVAVLQQLARDYAGGSVVIGTHGNLLALMLRHFDPGIDYSFWSSLSMPDVYRLQLETDNSQAAYQRFWPPDPTTASLPTDGG